MRDSKWRRSPEGGEDVPKHKSDTVADSLLNSSTNSTNSNTDVSIPPSKQWTELKFYSWRDLPLHL